MLFKLKNDFVKLDEIKNTICTPLGDLRFDYHLKEHDGEITITSYKVGESATLTRYVSNIYEIELLVNEVKIPLEVEKCFGVVWRFKLKQAVSRLTFQTAFLKTNISKVYDGQDHGEDLYALKWHNDSYQLHIGTEDHDFLHERIMLNDYFPVQSDYLFSPFYEDEDGLSISLENLEVGKIGQVQFVLCYAKNETNNLATWFGVDLKTSTILERVVEY